MKLKRASDGHEFFAKYVTYSASEFPKDGELELLRLSKLQKSQRAAEPGIYSRDGRIAIGPEEAPEFEVLEVTEIGEKNLKQDGFKFKKPAGAARKASKPRKAAGGVRTKKSATRPPRA